MVRQSILTTTTPLLIAKGRQTNIPEKAPAQMTEAMAPPEASWPDVL